MSASQTDLERNYIFTPSGKKEHIWKYLFLQMERLDELIACSECIHSGGGFPLLAVAIYVEFFGAGYPRFFAPQQSTLVRIMQMWNECSQREGVWEHRLRQPAQKKGLARIAS